ncbi:hypothetical protein GC093_09805 [Paenibacillus sp. LMG 31456]|uniref:DUF1468 domain-containing protein n=1 Tax=Paenibacillus foliorum TaxID=2654974 RepID=A0A972GZM9_9BACL|nr:tripartite tricarboxylate transporter TctB family protein [Paenibacillus foliorum]NOU93511.1 hypothetical protein [Paenibacillus foliorum]
MGKQNAGVWVGVSLFLFAAVLFWQSLSLKYQTNFGPGPGMFPRWLIAILMLFSLIYIWQSIKKVVIRFADVFPKGRELGNVLSVLTSVVVFMLIVNFVGFITAGTVLLFMLFAREYKWYSALGISLLVSILLFVIFKSAFSIPLPVNVWGW